MSDQSVASFVFDRVGAVPVSPAVDHGLMTSRAGKSFVSESVYRSSCADWDIGPPPERPRTPGWKFAVYLVPDSLRNRCSSTRLLVAASHEGKMVVLFPFELEQPTLGERLFTEPDE